MSFWVFSWLALSSSFRAFCSAAGSLAVALGDLVAGLHLFAHQFAHLLALFAGQVQFLHRAAMPGTVLAHHVAAFHRRGQVVGGGRGHGEGRQGGGDEQGG